MHEVLQYLKLCTKQQLKLSRGGAFKAEETTENVDVKFALPVDVKFALPIGGAF